MQSDTDNRFSRGYEVFTSTKPEKTIRIRHTKRVNVNERICADWSGLYFFKTDGGVHGLIYLNSKRLRLVDIEAIFST